MIQMGMIIAAESLAFGFEEVAETGEGSGPTTSPSTSCSGFALRNWAWSTRSIGRPTFSKNFSAAIPEREGVSLGFERRRGRSES